MDISTIARRGQFSQWPKIVVVLGNFVISGWAWAVPVPVINPSFESDPAGAPTAINNGVPTGWSAYNPAATSGVFFGSLYAAPDNYPDGAPDGNHVQVNYIASNNAADQEFGVFQTLSSSLAANTLYTLTVEVGNIASGENDLNVTPDNPDDDVFFDIAGFNGYRVELRTASAGGSGQTLIAESLSVSDGNSIPDGEFRTVSLVLDSRHVAPELIGEPLEILLVNLNEIDPAFVGRDRETNFDNVRLDAAEIQGNTVQLPLPMNLILVLGGLTISIGGRKLR